MNFFFLQPLTLSSLSNAASSYFSHPSLSANNVFPHLKSAVLLCLWTKRWPSASQQRTKKNKKRVIEEILSIRWLVSTTPTYTLWKQQFTPKNTFSNQQPTVFTERERESSRAKNRDRDRWGQRWIKTDTAMFLLWTFITSLAKVLV